MEWGVAATLIVCAILGAVFLGIPIAVSLGLVSVAFIWALSGFPVVMSTIATSFMDFWSSYILLAMLLFILMGEFLFTGGVAGDLFEFAAKWLRRVPGGLAMVAIGAGALFGAISGSSLAGIATIGVLSGPEMLKRGYDKRLAAGSIAAAGTLAQIIPPSTMMVLYAGMVEVSVGRQLMAGLIPGILLAVIFAIFIVVFVRLKPSAAPVEPPVPWSERFAVVKKLVLPFIVAALVLGSIYTGITTATEAAGVGAVIGIIIAIAYRKLGPKVILKTSMSAVQTTAFIMFIAVGGKLLSWCLTYYLIPQQIVSMIGGLTIDRYAIIALIMLLLFILGMFIDPVSIIIISVPILLPVLTALDFDLIWFGVVLMVNLGTALITPPLGFALYIVKGILGDQITLGEVLKGGLFFLLGEVLCIVILIAFPIIVLWLPTTMMGA